MIDFLIEIIFRTALVTIAIVMLGCMILMIFAFIELFKECENETKRFKD